MKPWLVIGTEPTPDGAALVLRQRGTDFMLTVDDRVLMTSAQVGSEQALARWTIERMGVRPEPDVLIGGLGCGFTLAEALRCLETGARVVVCELIGGVVQWNREALGSVAGYPLRDRRVTVHVGDVREVLSRGRGSFDAVLLDVDNGPAAFSRAANAWLYGAAGLEVLWAALRQGGVASVWSRTRDEAFTRRLRRMGFHVEVKQARAGVNGRAERHWIWLAQRPHR